MKKTFFLYPCYALMSMMIFTACNNCKQGSGNVITMDRNISSFSSIRIEDGFTVTLLKDSIKKVEVVTDDNLQSYVLTYVYNNMLIVETNFEKCIKKSSAMHINIYAPSFEKIELRGSGNITGADTIQGDHLQINIEGSGSIKLTANAQNIDASINGSGKQELYGTVTNLEENIHGSGYIQAFGLSCSSANATIKGSGSIETSVTVNLNASVRGSGVITYSGNPIVNSNTRGSGQIIHQ